MDGVHRNGHGGAGRNVKAADGVVDHRDARNRVDRRMQAQRFVDDLAGVLQIVHVFRGGEPVAQHRVDFGLHLRAELPGAATAPSGSSTARWPKSRGRRRTASTIWSRSDLSSNSLPSARLVVTMRLSTPQPSKSVARWRLMKPQDAGVERGDGRVEARDQLLRMRYERAHDIARRLRPVFLDGRGHFAEFIGDVGERLAEQVSSRQQLRQAIEFRLDVEDLAAIGVAVPAIAGNDRCVRPSSRPSCRWRRA